MGFRGALALVEREERLLQNRIGYYFYVELL